MGRRRPDGAVVLIDSGFGHDAELARRLLAEGGVEPAGLALIVNTHHYCDRVGGNYDLQARSGMVIAAHRWEADMVNSARPSPMMSLATIAARRAGQTAGRCGRVPANAAKKD